MGRQEPDEGLQHDLKDIVERLDRMSDWVVAMNENNAMLLKAINANMEATNELLRTSQSLRATQDVLDEGEYLYQVLATGAQGTEAGGPLLRDAPRVLIEVRIMVPVSRVEGVG